jgi:hypothetical protein
MKEEIKQILKDNAWEMEKDRYVIGLSNIDDIAEKVVKLFLIPPVISSVCSCDNVHGEIETKTNYCWYCLKTIKEQTDL